MTADKLPLDAKALDALLSRLRERCSRGAWSSGVMVGTRYEGQAILDLIDSLRQQSRAALALAAQVERLTEALEGFAMLCKCNSDVEHTVYGDSTLGRVARAALASTPSSALASLRAQVRADALREAHGLCVERIESGGTAEECAAAILAAANAQGETK